jgi:hypothetical protein
MERAMTAPDFGRVSVIGGATAAVLIALLVAKPFYSVTAVTSTVAVSQTIVDREPATEFASIAASPTIDSNPQFLFGCGDGSNGYYAEQPQPTLALVSYRRMP